MQKILSPNGLLRAAINYGNPILAQKDEKTGQLVGVSVDITREIAKRLGAKLSLVPYDGAGKVVASVSSDAWNICFLAIDPLRAETISYSTPYVGIEGGFVVNDASSFKAPLDLDKKGVRIGVGKGAAYDLFLSRTYKNAEFVRYPTSKAVFQGFLDDKLDAGAGIMQPVKEFVASQKGTRLIEQPFMEIHQAIALPKSKQAALAYVEQILTELRASDFIKNGLAKTGQDLNLALKNQ
jgi:polar amino acid transport system substrate-binding protein